MKSIAQPACLLTITLLSGCNSSDQPMDYRPFASQMAALEFILLDLDDELVLPPNLDDPNLVVDLRSDIPAKTVAATTITEAVLSQSRGARLRELEALPFFKLSSMGQAYIKDPENRALVFGFPRERCPIHVVQKDDGLSAALVSAYARCLELMPMTPFSDGCGCRVEALGTHLLVDPSTLDYRDLLPLSMITLDLSIAESDPAIVRGSVRAGEAAGEQMPVELLTEDGNSLCRGTFSVEMIGSLEFTIECPASETDYSGWGGLVGYNHGRAYGVSIGVGSTVDGSPEQLTMAWYGYDEPQLTRLEAKTVAFMKSWQARNP